MRYIHVPSEKRSKLEKKKVKCIFIGYGIGVQGYKIWDPFIEKVLYSRSVIFHELKPSTIDLWPKKEEKQKEVVQIPSTPKKELRAPSGLDDEKSSRRFESSKEE